MYWPRPLSLVSTLSYWPRPIVLATPHCTGLCPLVLAPPSHSDLHPLILVSALSYWPHPVTSLHPLVLVSTLILAPPPLTGLRPSTLNTAAVSLSSRHHKLFTSSSSCFFKYLFFGKCRSNLQTAARRPTFAEKRRRKHKAFFSFVAVR